MITGAGSGLKPHGIKVAHLYIVFAVSAEWQLLDNA